MKIRFFGAARAAAGTSESSVNRPPSTLSDLIAELTAMHPGSTESGTPFSEILQHCTFLLDGVPLKAKDSLTSGQCLDVLPPFAGG